MPKSKNTVSKLATLLADIRRPYEMQDFLQKFLTENEQTIIQNRLEILELLHQGKSYEEIQNELSVSSATISSVAQVKNSNAAQIALKKIKLDDWAEKVTLQIEKFFGNAPKV